MSRSVMDLKEVCLELCAGGVLIKAMELVKLPNYQSLDPVEFLYECLVSEAARGLIERLAGCDWIRNGEHCVITGATGSGKTWLASALMNAAIRAGFRAKYYRVNDLLLEYAESASNTTLRASKKKPRINVLTCWKS